MPLDRSNIFAGPAIITFKGQTFYTKDDIKVDCDWETSKTLSSMYGQMVSRMLDRKAVISFIPVGQLSTGLIAVIWSHFTSKIGTRIYTGTDYPVEIWTEAGKKITFASGAVTSFVPLKISAADPFIGQMQITCINANNTAWSGAGSFCTVTTAAFTDPATLTSASILQAPAVCSWAATGAWSSFDTEDGVNIDGELGLTWLKSDTHGTYNAMVSGLAVRAKCKPLGLAAGIAEAEMLSGPLFQDTGCVRGMSAAAVSTSHDLIITAGVTPLLLTATLEQAAMISSGMAFGSAVLRNGEVGWEATRTFTGSTVNALAAFIIS